MRKLVTVRRVSSLKPIPDADLIECATVEGWKCVALKGDFAVGDQCLYFEIDSFLLESDPRFEVLMKDNKREWNGLFGIKITTREFRKQISQGLALPLKDFPEVQQLIEGLDDKSIRAMDFTDVVGVVKWEAIVPGEIMETVRGGMPTYLPATGGERIQNIPALIEECPDELFEESIKLDGFSMSVFKHGDDFGVCDRSWWFKDDTVNEYMVTAARQGLVEALKKHPMSLGLQGELIGPGVRKNKEKLAEKEFRLFRIWDIENSRRCTPEERDRIVLELRELGANLLTTKFTGIFKLSELGTMDDMLARADGTSLNPDTKREGLFYHSVNGRGSFKVISNRYLLKNREA